MKRRETKVGKAMEQGKNALWGILKFVGTVGVSAVVSVVVVEKFQQFRGARQNPELPPPEPEAPAHPAMVFTGQSKPAAGGPPIVQYFFAPKPDPEPNPEPEPVEVVEEIDPDEAYLNGWLEE